MVLFQGAEYEEEPDLQVQHCELYEARFKLQQGNEASSLLGEGSRTAWNRMVS